MTHKTHYVANAAGDIDEVAPGIFVTRLHPKTLAAEFPQHASEHFIPGEYISDLLYHFYEQQRDNPAAHTAFLILDCEGITGMALEYREALQEYQALLHKLPTPCHMILTHVDQATLGQQLQDSLHARIVHGVEQAPLEMHSDPTDIVVKALQARMRDLP